MNDDTYWSREHSAEYLLTEDNKSKDNSQIYNRKSMEEEVWSLFRKLEAEPDHQKRILIRHKIWDMVENGGGKFFVSNVK